MSTDSSLISNLDFIVTTDDVHEFIDELSQLEKSVFNVNENAEKKAEEIFSHSKLLIIRPLMQQEGVDFSNKAQIKGFVANLTNALRNLTTLKLVIACEPNEATLKDISAWIRQHTSGKVVLDIEVNEEIIGGAVIEYNGVYKDYSLRKKLKEEEIKSN